jgi:hypothetical protein
MDDDVPSKSVWEKDIKRMEVHENSAPIIGFKGHTAHRLVLKTVKPSPIILPDKLKNDY